MKKNELKKIQSRVTQVLKQTSKHLEGVGKEAKILVKRGENELSKISRMGKAQFEILALSVKKEQLYRRIGMKVWKLSTKGKLTTDKLKAFCKELSEINKRVKSKKKTIDRVYKGK
ncbi:MAG: hypothetical protein HQ575_00605 [Candidatus Omnitrophica bacterium]|nr:hypothetical protein [Candidatus Omnitrophota bacterium]